MATFTRTCEWCGQPFTKDGKPSSPPRFCNASCSAKWRMSRPGYAASLTTDKKRRASSEHMRQLRERPDVAVKLHQHLHGPNNPLRDPVVRARAQATLRAQGYRNLTGGNGQLTVPQKLLAAITAWPTEYPIKTGRKPPYPAVYKVDLASPELMIAIEIDGESHKNPKARERDARQDRLLTDLGWTVVRLTNDQVLVTDEAVDLILSAIAFSTSRRGPATT